METQFVVSPARAEAGRRSAVWWFWRQCFKILPPPVSLQMHNSPDLIRTHKMMYRNRCNVYNLLISRNTAVVETILPYILEKTQHPFTAVREYAIKNLAALILEDYLKFRGNLLVYVFAGLLDKERDIKDLVVELIMKYTSEKNEIFLRSCLLECPFVFNNCACFGQGRSPFSSTNILTGTAKKPAREHIYQYLLRKIDPMYLYMYFENMTRLLEFIEKVPSLAKSPDLQASVLDIVYICTQICVVNEKHKKNLEKIFKDNHDGDGVAINQAEAPQAGDAAGKEADAGENGEPKKGRGNKKNAPTLASSLAIVERVVPSVAAIYELLQKTNPKYFRAALDALCDSMCVHFESLIEYAQPREFWQAHLKRAKQAQAVAAAAARAAKRQARRSESRPPSTPRSRAGSRAGTPVSRAGTPVSRAGTPVSRARTPVSRAATPTSRARAAKSALTPSLKLIAPMGKPIAVTPTRSRRTKESDSGLCTIDDADENYLSDESAFSELTISDVRSKRRAQSRQSISTTSGRQRKSARR